MGRRDDVFIIIINLHNRGVNNNIFIKLNVPETRVSKRAIQSTKNSVWILISAGRVYDIIIQYYYYTSILRIIFRIISL